MIGRWFVKVIFSHWNGELSLARSFWLSGLFPALIGLIAERIVTSITTLRLPTLPFLDLRVFFVALLGFLGVFLAVVVWWLVGCWRSARGRSGFWPACVRLVVALEGSLLMLQLAFAVPAVPALADSLFGADPFGGYEITLSEDGTAVQVVGPIGWGFAARLHETLQNAPNASVVRLNSPGGRGIEAYLARRTIRKHRLATYVDCECSSACGVLFLAGEPRVATRDARLGFHRPWLPFELNEVLAGFVDYEGITRELVRLGLEDAAFVRRVLETPGTEVWYPSSEELLKARVVTHVVDGNLRLGQQPGTGAMAPERLEIGNGALTSLPHAPCDSWERQD